MSISQSLKITGRLRVVSGTLRGVTSERRVIKFPAVVLNIPLVWSKSDELSVESGISRYNDSLTLTESTEVTDESFYLNNISSACLEIEKVDQAFLLRRIARRLPIIIDDI
jgi:hypothetical protein